MSRKRLERKPIKETENHYSVAAENAQKRNRERKIVRRVYSVLSVLVAVLMFYYLMKPAITLEAHPGDGNPQLICGMEEHVHTEACWGYDHEAYEPVYVNSLALNCPFVPHVHDGKCLDADGNLICGISEEYRHVHDEYCYDHGTLVCTLEEHAAEDDLEELSVLVCGQEESTGHVHTDACYTTMWFTDEDPICGLQEGGPHTHTEECFGLILICEEEHEHTDACFAEGLICGLEEGQEHVHALECYPSMKELSCGQEEAVGHTHTESCYAMQLVEKEIHVHSEECYTDGVLTCGEMEIWTHQHTPECWQETQVLVNGGHVHNEECVKILVCGYEEHVHSQACYSGDPEAVKALVQENGSEEPMTPESEENASSDEAPAEEELAAEGTDKLTAQNGEVSETAGKDGILEEEHTENEAQEDSALSMGEESELVEEAPEDLNFESDALELVEEDVEWDSETVLVEEEQTETEAQTGSENHDPVSMDETVDTETYPEAGSDEMEDQTASDEHEQVSQDETAESDWQPEKEAGDAGTETLPAEDNAETDVSTEGEHASGEPVEVEEHIDGNSTETAENPETEAASEHEEQAQFTSLHFVTDITRSEDGQFSVQLHTDEGVRVQDILEVAGVAADQVSIASDIPFLEIGEDYFACRFAFGEGSVVLTAGETEITVLCSFVSGQATETESDQEAADDMPEEAGAQPEDQTAEEDGTESTTGDDKDHAGNVDASATDSGDGENDTNKEENGGENQEASAENSQNSGSTAEEDAGAGDGAEENLNEGSQKAAESEDAHAGEEEAGSETGSEEDAAGADDETGNTENEGEGTAEADDSESSDETADADDGHMSRENAGTVSSEDPNAEVRENPEITVLLNGEATEQVRAELVTEDAQALMALVQGYLQTEHNTNLDETAEETAEEVNEVTEAQIWRVLRVSSEEMMEGHAEITVPVNEDFAGVIPQNADLTSVNYRIFRVDEENGVVIPADNFTVDADAETVKSFSLGTDESGVYAFVCTVSYAYREYQAEIELDLSDFMVVPEELSGESGISVITESAAENVPDQGSAMRRQTMSRQSKKMSTAPAAESAGIAIDVQKLMDQLAAQGIDTENEFAGIRMSMNADEGADMDFSGMSEESSDGNVFFDGQSLKILDNGTVVLKGKHITVTVRVVGFHKAGETSTYEFTFGENKSVYMSEIFASVGMPENFVPARFSYTLSDESLVSLVREENDCLVTANAYFDEVTLNIERGWYRGIILLRNMKPETEEKTEMWSEDGTVSIMLKDAVALPEGTKPVAVPSEGVDIQEYLAADFGENADVQLKWFDISLGDVHEISATVMLPGVIELPENSENRVMHVDARVYHVREDGIHTLDATVNGSDITFETDGFSEFGIAWVVTFENEETGETYTLTLPGARDIPVDEILEGIGLNADPADEAEAENETAQNHEKRVEKVESSDEEIVRILQTEESWAVRILKEGKAHLIITMNDETVITIHVVSQGITKKTSDDETVEISTVNSLYLPEDAYVKAEQLDDVSAQTAIETVKANMAVSESGEETGRTVYKVFDISLENVNTDEYDGFQVAVKLPEHIVGRDFRLFHIHEGIMEEIGLETIAGAETMDGQSGVAGIAFETSGFSEFVVSYTVDFHWEVDGHMYEFSIPGGGFTSFYNLIRDLGIKADDPGTETDEIQELIDGVAGIEFSNPDLVSVSKVEEDTTVGAVIERLGLVCEYSQELTEDQIARFHARRVKAGDWALISLEPFDTQESLTVTMKNGDRWTIQVTDAQISTHFITDDGELYEVTVTYGEDAGIPEGSTLKVTEFEEGSEQYTYALHSVLADKKARGETVDLNGFGFAALDISIISPEGEEIEPLAAVQVDMQIKSLPGVENLSEIADTLAIQHHVEAGNGVAIETVFGGDADASFRMKTNEEVTASAEIVDPWSVEEEDFHAPSVESTEGFETAFECTAFSTFSISWNNAYGNGVKIHYVDTNGRELEVKNTTFPTTLTGDSASPAYLIYDIDGYEYDHTYRRYYSNRRWNEQNIYPELWRHDASYSYGNNWNGWMYTTDRSTLNVLNSGDSENEIYVVYKKKNDITEGGTPTVKQSGDVKPPVAPRINKESTPNGDDTNTLALSLISDTAKLEVEKLADVIVVFDVSGSMSTNDMGDGSSRLQAAKDAVNNLAAHLAEKKNSDGEPLVRMSLIKFSTKASTVLGMTDLTNTGRNSGGKQIEDALDHLTADGGTNWDHALQLANEENDLDSGRATFVIFVTDGDPTFRNARMNVTDADLAEEKNYHEQTDTYTDPNYWYLSDTVYGPGNNDRTGKCYEAAVLQGRAIVSAGKNIYTIGISNDVKKVEAFNSDIGGNGAYLAGDTQALQNAFADIEASISGASGWGNIQMTDGITNLSNTVQKTGLTNVGGDFTYWKAPAPENWAEMTEAQKNAYKPTADSFVQWDPASEGASPAVYNSETGAVEWNMGKTFMPEAGETYQVRFKVWPSQEAYDYIAKLNNGTISYDDLSDDVKAQIIKNGNSYTLKTNEPDARTTYQPAMKTGDTVTVSGEVKTLKFPSVEDLHLSVDKMKVQKEWVNDLDPDARWKSDVTLLLTDGNGNLYKSIDLNEENKFTAEDNFISCGLAKIENGELIIYEAGHDFKLTEPAEYAYYWDLDAHIYRPMIIDAQLTMLMKTDAPPGMEDKTVYTYQGGVYYKIDGSTYLAIAKDDAAAAITATNIRRSNLNLTKKVVDEEGNPATSSDLFTFKITINDKRDDDVWFSVMTDANDISTIVKDLTTNATAEKRDGEYTGYYHAPSGSEITVSMEPGWNLRFTNLPNGTTYTIEEVATDNYTFQNAVIDNNGTFSITQGITVGIGTINESNKQYTVTYTNKAATQLVYIYKTDQSSQQPLQSAVFSLYTKAGYEADPQKVLKTGLVSDENGMIDLGRVVIGEYRLVETSAPPGYILLSEPVEITVKENEVLYRQISNSQSSSREGVSGNKESGYTLVVTNNAGYELPSTGGPGRSLFYLLGSVLIVLAGTGIMSVRSRRRDSL